MQIEKPSLVDIGIMITMPANENKKVEQTLQYVFGISNTKIPEVVANLKKGKALLIRSIPCDIAMSQAEMVGDSCRREDIPIKCFISVHEEGGISDANEI